MRSILERFSSAESRRSLITIAVTAIAIAAFLAVSISIVAVVQKNHELKSGASEGFRLNGMYTTGTMHVDSGYCTAAFLEATGGVFDGEPPSTDGFDGRWQMTGENIVNGLYKKTFDPNIFDMYDEAGNHVGFAHLAYTAQQHEGLIYIAYQEHRLVMSKTDNFVSLQHESPLA